MKCTTGKRQFRDISLAWAEVDKLRAINNQPEGEFKLHPFYCQECRHYHIGHNHDSLKGRLKAHFGGKRYRMSSERKRLRKSRGIK